MQLPNEPVPVDRLVDEWVTMVGLTVAYARDAAVHMRASVVRGVLIRVDATLRREGVPLDIRMRVVREALGHPSTDAELARLASDPRI